MTLEFFFAPWKKIVPLSNEMFKNTQTIFAQMHRISKSICLFKHDLYRLDFMAI